MNLVTRSILVAACLTASTAAVASGNGFVMRKPALPASEAAAPAACTLSTEVCAKLSAYATQTAAARAGTGSSTSPGNSNPQDPPAPTVNVALEVAQLRSMARGALLWSFGNAGSGALVLDSTNAVFHQVFPQYVGRTSTPVLAGSTAWTVTMTSDFAASTMVWYNIDNPSERVNKTLGEMFFYDPETEKYYAQGARINRNFSGSVSISGVPADKCVALAQANLPGIGCSGGVATAIEVAAEVVSYSNLPDIPVTLPPVLPYPVMSMS